jgi:cell division protein FtsB
MFKDSRIAEFLEKAHAAGIPDTSLVGLLTSQGWREKDVYRSLGDHYEKVTGIGIPQRSDSGASAKDAFFYLLIFSTLATWTCGLGSLAFQLIDRWLADPLFTNFQQRFANYEVTWALSAVIIAFPIYLLITRAVLREAAADPEKLDSAIRKWLTYMALVIAASIFMGDLITALAFLLRGEITSRFLAKSLVVLTLSGGVFYYYFGGLSKGNASAEHSMRNRVMAAVSSVAVILMVVLGFSQSGAPQSQRDLRADEQRLTNLYQLSMQIENYWRSHNSQLPANVAELHSGQAVDPITHARYVYIPGQGSKYQLCAVFSQKSEPGNHEDDLWNHAAGHACFQLDAATMTPYPQQ